MTTTHLDLGCGPRPRNPYGCDEVHAIDIVMPVGCDERLFRRANLSVQAIPHPDASFDSVSAYDFLEHVPRLFPTDDGMGTRFPFVELMSEVHRVLKPGGRFYAVTPGAPRIEAFTDPTHVNPLSRETHLYFTEPELGATVYGFTGRFKCMRVMWIRKKLDFEPLKPDLRHRLRRLSDVLMRRRAHLLWEFEALK
ncbi:MAG: class I SAM-dependent methyltransferase [Pseudorhodobacter sp.]|nr:class I SAM-dependent methyltransferase [Rhizobacter sp.]